MELEYYLRGLLQALPSAARNDVQLPQEVWNRLWGEAFISYCAELPKNGEGEPMSEESAQLLFMLAAGLAKFH